MYTLDDYLWMLTDDARVAAYSAAIRAAVKPGDRVIEIGAGIGFFSVLAARAGAAHVDALDTNPVVHLGRRIAEANGCGDRIAFHAIDAEQFEIDTPSDVIVADLRGPNALAGTSLRVMLHARRRLLRPGGVVVPARDTLFCAPARRPAVFRREVEAALARPEVSLGPAGRIAYDTPIRCPVEREDLLASGEAWAEIDYAMLEGTDCSGGASWAFERPVSVGGLAIWFDCDLGNAVGFSTIPGGEVRAYSQMFVPFREAVEVESGDSLRTAIDVRLVRNEYVWSWRAWVKPAGAPVERLLVSQNSLAQHVIDPAALRHSAL